MLTTPDTYHLDYETFSPEILKDVGAFKYAAHYDAEILVMAIAKNDEAPLVWSVMDNNTDALALLSQAVQSGAEIWAHNAQFEFAITKHLFHKAFLKYGLMTAPALTQWRCTAALCRLAAIPSSLAQAGEFLQIPMPKDKDGTKLIQQFCLPRKPTKGDSRTRIYPADARLDFQMFVDYCRRDVEAERLVHHALVSLTKQSHPTAAHFHADLRMNDRGIPLKMNALHHAESLIGEYTSRLIPIFQSQTAHPTEMITLPVTKMRKAPKQVSITSGFNPSQNEMMQCWLKGKGFTGQDLQADTVSAWLTSPLVDLLTPEAVAALTTYSLIGSAAVKKIPAMLNMADTDGKVRGALLIYGAERTHRWTGKGIQPQNYARPTIAFSDLAYACVCAGATIDELEALFGDLFQVMISVIRNFIQPRTGMVLQADYAAIEARVAPWLVGQEKTLQKFRNNEPLYEIMASLIFGKPVSKITKDERFIGKQAVLGCSYNMGRPKFRATCESYGFAPTAQMIADYKPRHADFIDGKDPKEMGWTTVDPQTEAEWSEFCFDDLADRAVTSWRTENPVVVASWKQLDDAAKAAIKTPNTKHKVGKLILSCSTIANFTALCIKLPSGHNLIYPKAEIITSSAKFWTSQIRFWGVIPNSAGTWGWCHTYGGKLLENATQACAGDIMREGMLAAESAGYKPFMLVHDEILCTQEDGQTHEELCQLLCTMPKWADGLPLAAEGSTIQHYKK